MKIHPALSRAPVALAMALLLASPLALAESVQTAWPLLAQYTPGIMTPPKAKARPAANEADRRRAATVLAEARKLLDDYSGLRPRDLDIAAAKIDEALKLDEAGSGPLALHESARVAMKRHGMANKQVVRISEQLLREAIAQDEKYGDAYVLLGYVLAHQGRFREADEAFDTAQQLPKTSAWLESNIAESRELRGDEKGAEQIYTKVADAPDKPRGLRLAALNWLHELYMRTDRFDDAESAYRRMIGVEPKYAPAYVWYSYLLRVHRLSVGAAESHARQAVELGEETGREQLAHTLYLRWAEALAAGKKEQAAALFSEASRYSKDMSELVHEIGRYPGPHPIVGQLRAKGISIDTVPGNPHVTTPLEMAARGGNLALVTQMIQSGAHPNTQGFRGNTPLMMAASRGDEPMVRLLLSRGADPTLRGFDMRTAENIASDKNHRGIAALLASARKTAGAGVGPLTPDLPFRVLNLYRVKKTFVLPPQLAHLGHFDIHPDSRTLKAGEELVFEYPYEYRGDTIARFLFIDKERRMRQFAIEFDRLQTWSDYFEDLGPFAGPYTPPRCC